MTTTARVIRFVFLGLACAVPPPQAFAQPAPLEYTVVFYQSGGLRIQAYLYKPQREGLFPLIIYNHGSRKGHEQDSMPFRYVGSLLLQSGFGVLVPERRGYGQSDGKAFYDEVGTDVGARFVARLEEETGDVLASLDYLKTLPWVDQSRIGIMGWSLGGIISMMTAARSDRFGAVVDQAGGSLTWPISGPLQKALKDAAASTKTPTLFMDAKNDRTTDSVTTLAKILDRTAVPHKLIVYEPFTPTQNPEGIAPGHLIFSGQGIAIWREDVRDFFSAYLRK